MDLLFKLSLFVWIGQGEIGNIGIGLDWISFQFRSIPMNGTITISSKLNNQGLYFTVDSDNSRSFDLVMIQRGKRMK